MCSAGWRAVGSLELTYILFENAEVYVGGGGLELLYDAMPCLPQ